MFKQINKVNATTSEVGKALINLCAIIAISQQPNHFSNKLFNENGDLVSQEQDKPWFEIHTNEGLSFVIEEEQYQDLKKDLNEFVEIKKINSRGEEGLLFLKLENVKSIVSQPKVAETDENGEEKTDSEGNVVYKPTQYALIMNVGKTYYVLEEEFEKLSKALTETK